jgi:hypothetical protein
VKNKKGDIGVYKKKISKWIKSEKPYRSQKRGLAKKSVYSARFGFLDQYNRKELQELICPSGFSIGQCFNILRKMWYGYHKARRDEQDIEGMMKYASAIQNIQEDMGLSIASFPNLGLHGNGFLLSDKKSNGSDFEGHTAPREVRFKRRRHRKKMVPNILKPDIAEGESLVTIADDFGPSFRDAFDSYHTVPELSGYEEGEGLFYSVDEIPFHNDTKKSNYNGAWSILTIADDTPPRRLGQEGQITVPVLLKPEDGEEVLTFADDVYCQP